jgi:thiol-disulfide isomerase/thioredoxin
MSMTPSSMLLEIGSPLPSFKLPDVNGAPLSSQQFLGAAGLLVVFICPHCPFVRHIRREFARFAREYQAQGLRIVAINSNDSIAYPDDTPEGMKKEIIEAGYTFPYLVDETQEIAKAFRAACTPDFFLFNREQILVYRGQFDGSRPGNQIATTGSDLRAAAGAVLAGRSASPDQKGSIGCNIKWKVGNEPEYFEAPAPVRIR